MAWEGYRTPQMNGTGMVEAVIGNYETNGAIRALAQEPIQNSLDAKDPLNNGGFVHVEYRLLRRWWNGKECYHLKVSDRGTTGLNGRMSPSDEELRRYSEEDRSSLRWHYFERLFDSNKGEFDLGSRGQGKSVFLFHSHIPGDERCMMMLYETKIMDGEYRLGDCIAKPNGLGNREIPYVGKDAINAICNEEYITADKSIKIPLQLEPLSEVGTRITIPFVSGEAVQAIRNGSLARWMQYLWWRAIVDRRLKITIVDEVRGKSETIVEPEWWKDEIWTGEATPPNKFHTLYPGFSIQLFEDIDLGQKINVKRLVLMHDDDLSKKAHQTLNDGEPNYIGIQLFRAGQCIETLWEYDFIPTEKKLGFRAFAEFDEETDSFLRDHEKTQHDGFHWRRSLNSILKPQLAKIVRNFAIEMGWVKETSEHEEADHHQIRTNQFVFNTLLSTSLGNVPIEDLDKGTEGNADKPWDVDVLIRYPNADTSTPTRINWGESIGNIRFVVNSAPDRIRRNTRFALEWTDPDRTRSQLWEVAGSRISEYRIGDRFLVADEIREKHIICPKLGTYRIHAVVYEGKKLVAKKSRRIFLEEDPPIRDEKPYVVTPSVVNETAPGEQRVQSGDVLTIQINGRNRTYEDLSAKLFVRMKEGQIVVPDMTVRMPAKPLGQDDRRHNLHWQKIRIVRTWLGKSGE